MRQLSIIALLLLFTLSCKKIEPDFTKPVVLENTPAPVVHGGWRKMGDFFNDNAFGVQFAFVLNDKAYFLVDMLYQDLPSDFWEYDPSTNKFAAKAHIPGREAVEDKNNRSFSMAIGGKGFFGLSNSKNGLNQIWAYDPGTDSWTRKADFPRKHIDRPGTFVLGNKGYFLGWQKEDGYRTDSMYEYDAAQDVWTEKDVWFPGRYYSLAQNIFSVDGKAYAWARGYFPDTTRVYQYDPIVDTFAEKSISAFRFITATNYPGYAIGNKIYHYLGSRNYDTKIPVNEIWAYDVPTDSWSKQKDFGGPVRYFTCGFSIGNKAYICFGMDGATEYNDVWEYNP